MASTLVASILRSVSRSAVTSLAIASANLSSQAFALLVARCALATRVWSARFLCACCRRSLFHAQRCTAGFGLFNNACMVRSFFARAMSLSLHACANMQKCPANTYSSPNATFCLPCPASTPYSDVMSTSIAACKGACTLPVLASDFGSNRCRLWLRLCVVRLDD